MTLTAHGRVLPLLVALCTFSSVRADPRRPRSDWRATPPPPGPERPAPTPRIERIDLPNGLALLLHERHDLPYVVIDAVLPAGHSAQPAGKDGLAAFTVEMLQSGTARRDALQLADDLATLGAHLDATVDADAARVGLGALKATLPEALALLAEVVVHPALREGDLSRARVRQQSEILERSDDPARVLRDVLAAVAFGERHPYGVPPLGTKESLEKLTRDDVVAFHAARYRPTGAALVLVGDLNAAEARALVEKSAFGSSWPRTAAPPILVPPAAKQPGGIVLVDRPAAAQTQVGFALPTVAPDHPDHIALLLANACLGATFSSRLNLNLREAHGYTYGAGTWIAERRGPSGWFGGAAVRSDVTFPSLGELKNELRRLVAEPPTEDEVALAREQLIHSVTGAFETQRDAARAIGDLFVLGLPLDHYRRFALALAALTPEKVQRAIATHFHPEEATILLVGDRQAIEPALRIQHRDPLGRVLP
ncbi:MAG: insulinase family protein [Myxococcales bacterium]|nr:insulinase family protein [Myxococcales bacterium]